MARNETKDTNDLDVCRLERAEPLWQLRSLHTGSGKQGEDTFIGKVNRFKHREETTLLSEPGLYRFNASLPHKHNISRSFLLSKLKAHEVSHSYIYSNEKHTFHELRRERFKYVKRITAPGSRWSLEVTLTAQTPYGKVFRKAYVLEPGNSLSEFFTIPKAFAPATCVVTFRGFAFRLLLVTSSIHFEACVDEDVVEVQPIEAREVKGALADRSRRKKVGDLAKELLKSLGEENAAEAEAEAKGEKEVAAVGQTEGNYVRYDTPEHTFLTELHIKQICSCLPHAVKSSLWRQRFNSYTHGSNITELVQRCTDAPEHQLFLVQDVDGCIFGVYLSNGLYVEVHERRGRFVDAIGDGQNFVFTFKERPALRVYAWKQTNNMFRLLSDTGMAFGGGGDGFALWINAALSFGTSAKSATYENAVLAQHESFTVRSVEVWAMTTGIVPR